MSDCKKEILVLFSGGRDSFLATCQLIEEGYSVYMVNYDNGCGMGIRNSEDMAKRIIKKYGEEQARFIGTKSIVGFWRTFFQPIFTMTPNEISEQYGQLTISQFHCLTCRTSMYVMSILICKRMGINYIAEGARKDQGFIIELEVMINRYKQLLKEYDIELVLPVYDLNDNWERKNALLIRGFLPKTYESQCFLGVPLTENEQREDVIKAVTNFYDKFMINKIATLIKTNERICLEDGEENFDR